MIKKIHSFHSKNLFFGAFALLGLNASAQVYNESTRELALPVVQVGTVLYPNVVVRLDSFTVLAAGAPVPANPTSAINVAGAAFSSTYNQATRQLSLLNVQVGSVSFPNVVVQLESFVVLAAGTATPVLPATGSALELAQRFFTTVDASMATAIQTTGAARFAFADGCWLDNGLTKTQSVADFDADPQVRINRNQFQIGSKRTGIAVTAERTLTNADGTTRREIDVRYVINYADGSKADTRTETLMTGSSSGATMADGRACTTAENKAEVRSFGNRRMVDISVTAMNEQLLTFPLAAQAVGSAPVVGTTTYSRYISLRVNDPAKVATYAIISGPGLTALVDGVSTPAAFKMISPRLLRDAPEFAGKRGNFVDWKDTDGFQVCRTSTNQFAKDDLADCVAHGANGRSFGNFNNPVPAANDASFNNLGLVAGGSYTFKVYAGNGWRTINGQQSETPIATYTAILENLPFSTVALAGASPAASKFPTMTTARSTDELAAAFRTKAAISTEMSWVRPEGLPDGRAAGLSEVYSFTSGRASAGTTFNPASRQLNSLYPASTATSTTFNIPAAGAALITPTYGEIAVGYTNRNGNNIWFIRNFQ